MTVLTRSPLSSRRIFHARPGRSQTAGSVQRWVGLTAPIPRATRHQNSRISKNGVGSNKPPKVDQPGDPGLVGGNRGNSISLKVTAKKGTTLRFICLFHPWMQAKVLVG